MRRLTLEDIHLNGTLKDQIKEKKLTLSSVAESLVFLGRCGLPFPILENVISQFKTLLIEIRKKMEKVIHTLSFPDLEHFSFLDDFSELDFDLVCAPASSPSPPSPNFKATAASTWAYR